MKKSRGFSSAMGALTMLVALVLFAGVLDRGYLFVRRNRLKNFVNLGARAGSAKIVDLIVEAAQNRIDTDGNPSGETQAIKILTPADRQWVLDQKDQVINEVLAVVRANSEKNNAGLDINTVLVQYPYKFALPCEDYAAGSAPALDIRVSMKERKPTILGGFYGASSTIVAGESIQNVQLCP